MPGPGILQGRCRTLEHRAQVGHRHRAYLALGGAKGSPHAPAHQAHRLFLGRAVVSCSPVGGRDRGQARMDRGGFGSFGQIGHVAGYGLRPGGQRPHPVRLAPGGELRPAGSVEPGRVLGPARIEVFPCVGGDLGHLDRLFGTFEQRHALSFFSSFVTNDKVALS